MEEIINKNMTIQEKLRDRIYELLPEKKELSFGCNTIEGIFLKQDKDKGYFYTEENLNIVSKNDFEILDIIGQPLRLADLLLAIGIKYDYQQEPEIYEFICSKFDRNGIDKKAFYNLSKDDIMLQTDEFCEFAYKLIK